MSFFLGLKSRFWAKKSDICHTIPILVDGLFNVCSPRRDRSFPTWGTIFWLSVPELQPFSWGHRLPITALALSARRPFGPACFARGLDNCLSFNDMITLEIFVMYFVPWHVGIQGHDDLENKNLIYHSSLEWCWNSLLFCRGHYFHYFLSVLKPDNF